MMERIWSASSPQTSRVSDGISPNGLLTFPKRAFITSLYRHSAIFSLISISSGVTTSGLSAPPVATVGTSFNGDGCLSESVILLANKELNKWCGTEGINYYEGIEALGFLFKYAVPKAIEELANSMAQRGAVDLDFCRLWVMKEWVKTWNENPEDATLALFWALWKVKEDSNEDTQ